MGDLQGDADRDDASASPAPAPAAQAAGSVAPPQPRARRVPPASFRRRPRQPAGGGTGRCARCHASYFSK